MSSKKRKSQKITFDARNNMKIKHYFSQIPKEEQNSPSTSQMKVESRKRPSDITNTIEQTSHLPKSKPQDLTATPKKKIEITLDVNIRKHKSMKYTLIHDEKESLYKGLVTLDAVKTEIDARPGQEMLVRGTKGIEGYLNLGMPLHCFPEKNHVEITFFKSSNEQKEYKQMSGRHDHASTECVKFYIHAIGTRVKKIVRCRKIHNERRKLCVFGFKGETIKDTLCKDGRFCALIEKESWRLIGDLDSIIESTQPVDELEGQLFQVEVERQAKRKATAPAPNLEPEEKVLKEYIVDEYPSLRSESKKIREYIKEKAEQRKKGKKTSLFTLHRRNFGKLTKNSTLVKVHKFLSQLGDSVGFLLWDNNGNTGCATCFVFSGPFILTCRHVINDIVGKGIEPSQWADIIGQCVKVIFSYEESLVKEENCFFLEPWFQISDGTLDYAVLKLKADGQPVPLELRDKIAPLPLNGLMYIIGHPQGESKRTDACAVIPQSEREQKYKENIQAGEAVGCNFPPHFVHMHTQNSFQKIAHNPDVLTYDTTFYWGSSGSPVFDSQGSLVAMHTAGITCEYQHGILNIIEFGSSMESILSDMKQKDEAWYNEVCVQPQDVEMLSQDY